MSFINQIESIIDEQKASYNLFVLKGVPVSVYQHFSETVGHPLHSVHISNGTIQLKSISSGFSQLIGSISNLNEKVYVLDYETFTFLGNNVNLDQLGCKICLIDNNLLNEYPNPSDVSVPDQERTMMSDAEQEENELFNKFYSNSIEFYDYTLVQYVDGFVEELECVERIILFPPVEPEITKVSDLGELPDEAETFTPNSPEYIDHKNRLTQDDVHRQVVIAFDRSFRHNHDAYRELCVYTSALRLLKIPHSIYEVDNRVRDEYRSELSDLLQKHWKSSEFRSLKLYKDPDISTELISLSQGIVVEEVIRQYESGRKGRPIRDIFLTAPTGAGKSLLFQMPGIYLSENYNAVTIVVSPLIALMEDQVHALKNERGYQKAAFINSKLSLLDREQVLQDIHEGNISILYLSPELLLSYTLETFIGDRSLGLLVIDEAHLVTTWGRDFRVDYWYLGNYIRKTRKYTNHHFPVLAVTATAVYSGVNDMAFQTLDALGLENAIMYIGKVRRDDIGFAINTIELEGNHEKGKISNTGKRVAEFIKNEDKTIVYCPWTNQLRAIRNEIPKELLPKVGLYAGSFHSYLKEEAYQNFLEGNALCMITTKAFGMGIDIDDITIVYHHAPSGHMADYIQEIGRLARRKDLNGTAYLEFHPKDLKFTRILHGLSSIKQFQVGIVLEKLLKIYQEKKKRNLLVSTEDFSHAFMDSIDPEQKVKSCLLLIEKDLVQKFGYNLVVARPKSLFTSVYARVNADQITEFEKKYSSFEVVRNDRIESKGLQLLVVIDLGKVWERHFSKDSFPSVKFRFFNQSLFDEKFGVSPQFRLTISLENGYEETLDRLTRSFDKVQASVTSMGDRFFTEKEFAIELTKSGFNKHIAKRIASLLLNIYSSDVTAERGRFRRTKIESYFQKRRSSGTGTMTFRVNNRAYGNVKAAMRSRFNRMFQHITSSNRTIELFLPIDKDKNRGIFNMAYLLEVFDLASFSVEGGQNPGIFIRINDPSKLKRILKSGYQNDILDSVDQRQKTSVRLMEHFFSTSMEDEERWDFIEDYFLGKSEEDLIGEIDIESEIEDID